MRWTGLGGLVDRILVIQRSHIDLAVLIAVLVFTLGMLATARRYSPGARTLPLIVGASTTVLVGYLLVANHLAPWMVQRFDLCESDRGAQKQESDPAPLARLESLRSFLWIIAFTLLIVLVGIDLGLLGFLLAYYRYEAGEGWFRSALYTAAIWTVVITLFRVILRVRLHEGIFISVL